LKSPLTGRHAGANRHVAARGERTGARPTGAAHGRNRAHSPRRLARVEPAREFAAAGARVRAGTDRESAAVAAPLAPATAVLCGPVCRRFHERRAGRQRTPRFAPTILRHPEAPSKGEGDPLWTLASLRLRR